MKEYSFLHALYLSFFSRQFYYDVISRWKGTGLAYLAALLALCTLPGVMKMQADVSTYINREAAMYIRQLPLITISKGELSISEPEPYIIKDEKTGDPFMIIDTTGSMNSLRGSKAMVLFTKRTIVLGRDGHESRTFNLSDFGDKVVIDRGSAFDFMDSFVETFPFIYYPVSLFFSWLLNTLLAVLYAVFGGMVARGTGASLDFKSLVRLAAVSLTPVLLSGALLTLAGVAVPFWWLVSVITPLGYITYAVKSIPLPDVKG
ncbi:MAG: DUF1189 domain-containing protein [Nitrospirae bacterium]|nr:MAG: DUF1189 domain-containing protein [Nitrospirota bacterium]